MSTTQRPYVVGLTGGIGSGKSTVTRLLIGFGIEVIDADDVSREVVVPGSPALDALVERFGTKILNADGTLKRERLRGLIFMDPEAKRWVEELLHPAIRARIQERIERSTSPWLMLSVPLLLENKNAYDFVDRVLVVDVPESVQLSRTMLRDNATKDEVTRIMQSQLPRGKRLLAADDVVENSGDPLQLQEQLLRLVKRYEELAHARHQNG
ncbi:MAG: dephospho-CoA kinase [Pseudomonadota bacterium]|nr:dephospho-CoA kinase [Pseudomonadota bacterium]